MSLERRPALFCQPTAAHRTSTVLNHTIPPFYACYLLRSLKQPNRTYIGSTPDPKRRLKQHNGVVKGGAFKTKRARPWTMSLLVHGFPSKLQALQFEWAWQNPHISRHLHAPTVVASSPIQVVDEVEVEQEAGKKKKRKKRSNASTTSPSAPQFPKTALSNRGLTKVQVLMWMLTSRPWKAFDLRVVCFEQLSKGWWERAKRLGASVRTEAGMKKFESKERGMGSSPWGEERGRFLEAVKVMEWFEGVHGETKQGEKFRSDDGSMIDAHWAKWLERVESASNNDCAICHQPVNVEDHLEFLMCTSETPTCNSTSRTKDPIPCSALYHLPCLAHHFTHPQSHSHTTSEPSSRPPSWEELPLLPKRGTCRSCQEELHWSELIRLSYRRLDEGMGKREKMKRVEERRRKKEEKEAALLGDGGEGGKKKKVGRGKGKEVVVDVDGRGSGSGSELSERFEFESDSERDEDEDEDEVERSLAISVEADGELEASTSDSEGEEEIVVPQKKGKGEGKEVVKKVKVAKVKVTKANVTKEPSSQKKRGRPKKAAEVYVELLS